MGYKPKAISPDDVFWVNKLRDPGWDQVSTSFRLCIWPRKCHYSKKNIWFKYAYRVRHTSPAYSPDDLYHTDRWYHKDSYIILRLQG